MNAFERVPSVAFGDCVGRVRLSTTGGREIEGAGKSPLFPYLTGRLGPPHLLGPWG